MKKLLALIIALLLISVCACAPVPSGSGTGIPHASKPQGGASDKGVDMEALWEELNGVWVYSGDSYYFLTFAVDNGSYCISTGILNSDYCFGGTVSDLKQAGEGMYDITLDIPERPDTEEGSGWAAYSAKLTLIFPGKTAGAELQMTNFADDNSIQTFTYMGKTHAEAADAIEAERAKVAKSALAELRGVWACNDSGSLWFVWFDEENGAFTYLTGLLYSGYALGGTVSDVYLDAESDGYRMNIHFPEVNVEGSDSNHDAFDKLIYVGCENIGEKRIIVTNIADDGSEMTFRYAAPDLASIDYDTVMGF